VDARHARYPGQNPGHEGLVGSQIIGHHPQQIVLAAGHQEAAHHLGRCADVPLEHLQGVLGLFVEGDGDEHAHLSPQPRLVEAR